MPTFTSIALDRLIEPKASKPRTAVGNIPDCNPEVSKSLEAENAKSCKGVNITHTVPSAVGENHVKFVLNGKRENNGANNDDAAREPDNEIDDFFDTQDSISTYSSIEGDTGYAVDRSLSLTTPGADFYDAWEELSSGNGPQLLMNDVEAELCATRVSLLMEMEKRKQAEDLLNDMQSHWRRIQEQLSVAGLNLPTDPAIADDEAEEMCREVHVVRFVSNSIGRGVAKAELEAEMEAQIESKNFEIARLMDKLCYYEAVNREMSQRNQANAETTRRLRQRRKRRHKWIWGSIGAAITLGSAAMAWSYISSSMDPSPLHTCEVNPSTNN